MLKNLFGKGKEGGSAGEIPEQIGKYRILERVAAGGFGTVYKAWDPVLQRQVALKTCQIENPEIRARFLREAQLAGKLHHPNITTVFEFGVENDVPFIACELLSGEDLSSLISQRRSTPLPEKIRILEEIASGLEHAHAAGVVHRDVKPANIRILEDGRVKIMDFGIAKAMDSSTDITKKGVTVGSSSYMAPEQIVGDPIDGRTDIFSLGVLAYELLSFRKPFRHESLFRLLEMIVKEEPEPLSEVIPELPAPVVAIVERAMRKAPADRFDTSGDLRAALTALGSPA